VRLSAIFGALVPLMSAFGFIAVIWYGSFLAIRGEISLGNLIGFLLYLTLLKQPLEQLGNMLNTVQRASASLFRLSELLEVVPDTVETAGEDSVPPETGHIEVRDLTFRYAGTERDVLRSLSFSVAPGKTLGIVGSIGSGKTSLAHLLLRLYEPPAGTIFVDGRDIRSYSLEHLRRAIAYVPQNSFLFSTSVSENIAFSHDGAPDQEAVVRASRIASVDEDVAKFPEGYATEIGERGVRLSGGQKQRVAIARMIYKDSPIRILDDSLSAVDTRTERRILENLAAGDDGRLTNSVTIVVSHRLSAVMNADEILLLEDGAVAERGSHAQLLALGGTYARLWELQAGEVDKSDSIAPVSVPAEILEILRTEDEEALNESVEDAK